MYNWGFYEDRDVSNNPICPFLAIYTCFLHVFLLSITIVFSKVSTIDSDSKNLDR